MNFETLTLLILTLIIIVREISHFLQVTKLEELLKTNDITEYYRAKGKTKVESTSKNQVMEEANDIAIENPNFDIGAVKEVIINGQKKPINIIQ